MAISLPATFVRGERPAITHKPQTTRSSTKGMLFSFVILRVLCGLRFYPNDVSTLLCVYLPALHPARLRDAGRGAGSHLILHPDCASPGDTHRQYLAPPALPGAPYPRYGSVRPPPASCRPRTQPARDCIL